MVWLLRWYNYDCLGRLGSGWPSFSLSSMAVLPRQLPLAGPLQNVLITRSAWVLWMNSWTFGLSCVPPRCL